MPSKKPYVPKERANEYEKKIKVHASFHEAMSILLGNKPKIIMTNIPLCKPVEFVFKKYDTNADDGSLLHENVKRDFLLKNYKIEIPKTLTSEIIIEVRKIMGARSVSGDAFLTIITSSNSETLIPIRSKPFKFSPATEINISFEKDSNKPDFFCDVILIDCPKPLEDTILKISCFKKS